MNFKTFSAFIIILILAGIVSATYATYAHSAFKVGDGKDIDLAGMTIGNGTTKDLHCSSNCTGFSVISTETNASNLTTGTLNDDRLSTNVLLNNSNQSVYLNKTNLTLSTQDYGFATSPKHINIESTINDANLGIGFVSQMNLTPNAGTAGSAQAIRGNIQTYNNRTEVYGVFGYGSWLNVSAGDNVGGGILGIVRDLAENQIELATSYKVAAVMGISEGTHHPNAGMAIGSTDPTNNSFYYGTWVTDANTAGYFSQAGRSLNTLTPSYASDSGDSAGADRKIAASYNRQYTSVGDKLDIVFGTANNGSIYGTGANGIIRMNTTATGQTSWEFFGVSGGILETIPSVIIYGGGYVKIGKAGKGITLTSPNGGMWCVTVADTTGTVTSTSGECS